MAARVTRLAPSPTGALHLGNARTFLINWAIARTRGWEILMRVEDLDGPRIKSYAGEQAIDDLRWLGLDWDGPALTQAHDLRPYRETLMRLLEAGMAFSCDLTRREVQEAASAPHLDQAEVHFSPQLRPTDPARFRFSREDTNYRFLTPAHVVHIVDQLQGESTYQPHAEVGDFVIWTRRGTPSYQLAVVVDDLRQGVSDVLRGDDLLSSAARQTMLYEALGATPPTWWHLPLVVGPDGRRLAKRHGDSRLITYREAGATPERIVGLMAYWSGVSESRTEMSAADFRDAFNIATIGTRPVTFTEEDHTWLLGG